MAGAVPSSPYIAPHGNGQLITGAIGFREGLDYAVALDDDNVATAVISQVQRADRSGAGVSYSGKCESCEGDCNEGRGFHVKLPPLSYCEFTPPQYWGSLFTPPPANSKPFLEKYSSAR